MSLDTTAPVKDVPPQTGDHQQQASDLSVYANNLARPTDIGKAADSTASLPAVQIVDQQAEHDKPAPSSGGLLGRLARGTEGVVSAVATGAYDSAAGIYHGAAGYGGAAVHAVAHAYENRGQIATNIGNGITYAAEHPLTTADSALHSVGHAAVTAGSAVISGTEATGSWIANHKLESTAIAASAAVEVLSVGTATPILAGIGAIGAAGTVHSMFALGDQLNAHGKDISVLADANASNTERDKAKSDIAAATGGDALGLVGAVAGLGAGRLIGAIRAPGKVVEDLPKTLPEALPKVPKSLTPPIDGADAPKVVTNPAASTQPTEVAKPQTHQPQSDSTNRPTGDGNAERVAEKHPPLTAEELKTERAAVENDLNSHHGAGGKTILEQLKDSNLTTEQRDRVLNTLAETRHSYMAPAANGAVSPEQLGSYRHTLGELKAGIESSQTNGLTPRETQDALLAGMLSDSHKNGWSASTGGNFFTHHLDGALAANTILGRQLGQGFDAQDLQAVKQAILEHQISPPQFMANAYTGEIRAGMKRAGVTPTAQDEQDIANIKKLMADPMHSPTEASAQGGRQIAFTQSERNLLSQYVGPGTENWYVPSPPAAAAGDAGAAGTAAAANAAPDVNKISAVTRTADIDDNYSAETDAQGRAIRGPFKIAGLRGPGENPPDLSLADATQALRNNMSQSEGLLTDADRARLASPERQAAADAVYTQARAKVGDWLTEKLGHAPDANTPYWGKPLESPAPGASADAIKEWKASPDYQLATAIQQRFAHELYEMRRVAHN